MKHHLSYRGETLPPSQLEFCCIPKNPGVKLSYIRDTKKMLSCLGRACDFRKRKKVKKNRVERHFRQVRKIAWRNYWKAYPYSR
jgi:hypothetical protein